MNSTDLLLSNPSEQRGWSIDGFARLVGFQVMMPSGNNVWFSPTEGLNLIYGRNGAGKSTLITALRSIFGTERNKTQASAPVRAYIELPIDLVITGVTGEVDAVAAANRNIFWGSSSLPPQLVRRYDPEHNSGFESTTHPGGVAAFAEAFSEALAERHEGDSPSETTPSDEDRLVAELMELILEGLRAKALDAERRHFGPPGAWLSELVQAMRKSLRERFSPDRRTVVGQDVVDAFERNGLPLPGFEVELFDQRAFHRLGLYDLITLYLFDAIISIERDLDSTGPEWPENLHVSAVRGDGTRYMDYIEDPTEIVRLLVEPIALRALDSKTVLWLEPSEDDPSVLEFGLAVPFGNPDSGPAGLAVQRLLGALEAPGVFSDYALQERPVTMAPSMLDDVRSRVRRTSVYTLERPMLDSAGVLFDTPEPTGPFAVFRGWAFDPLGTIRPKAKPRERGLIAPTVAVDLDAPVDIDQVARRLLDEVISDTDSNVLLGGDQFGPTVETPSVTTINERLSSVVSAMIDLDLGVVDCRLGVSDSTADWLAGRAARIEFRTLTTDDAWVGYDRLSSAQRYWVSALFKLYQLNGERRPWFVIADEPERGVHERAVAAIFRRLGQLDVPCVITTHSPQALRQSHGFVQHLTTDDTGDMRLEPVGDISDIAHASTRFGVSPGDLLATKRVLVIVEGAHDLAVVNELLKLSPDERLAERTLVAAMQGVSNMATVADSVIITEFTDLNIVAVSDNARLDRLRDLHDHASSLLNEGKKPGDVGRLIGLGEAARDASQEERVLLDLLDRSIRRGMLERLRLHPVSVRDIQEIIPASEFGLKDPWSELRRRYVNSTDRKPFKKWLEEHEGVRISAKTIVAALNRLDSVPGELVGILNEIAIAAAATDLGR